jgi:hypothetical protein
LNDAYDWRNKKAWEYARLFNMYGALEEKKGEPVDPNPPKPQVVLSGALEAYLNPDVYYTTDEVINNQEYLFDYERWSDASSFMKFLSKRRHSIKIYKFGRMNLYNIERLILLVNNNSYNNQWFNSYPYFKFPPMPKDTKKKDDKDVNKKTIASGKEEEEEDSRSKKGKERIDHDDDDFITKKTVASGKEEEDDEDIVVCKKKKVLE